jgi:hypothetical protein
VDSSCHRSLWRGPDCTSTTRRRATSLQVVRLRTRPIWPTART